MLNIGFACEWLEDKERTWSHTPFALMKALEGQTEVKLSDLQLGLHPLVLSVVKILGLRWHPHDMAIRSQYMLTRLHAWLMERQLLRRLQSINSQSKLDALLSIADIAPQEGIAQFIYYDICAAQLRQMQSHPQVRRYQPVVYSDAVLRRKELRQQHVFGSSAGHIAMSRFAMNATSEAYCIPIERGHVVHPASNVPLRDTLGERPMQKDFILFVGRDFKLKGGHLVLEAFERNRKKWGVDLVIAGPERWPMEKAPSEGVHFLGRIPKETLQSYFEHARAFVMPTYFEGFGMVFAESLCNGVPVVGRNTCAMPEIITEGHNGLLLAADSDSVDELSELMSNVIYDDAMRQRTQQEKHRLREYYSWDRVARQMIDILEAGTRNTIKEQH